MTHGDDSGLILPPKIAPIQVIIIPIITTQDDSKVIYAKADEILADLKKNGFRVKVDASDLHNPGWKFAHWEVKGVPLRIEFGTKDMNKGQITLFCRDNRDKFPVKYEDIRETVEKMLYVNCQLLYWKCQLLYVKCHWCM